MKISLLQLNILKGLYLDKIIGFVKKSDFDICTFQEVTKGLASHDERMDCFALLSSGLNEYSGVKSVDFTFEEDPQSEFGEAIFYKRSFALLTHEVIALKPFMRLAKKTGNWEIAPRTVIVLELSRENKDFFVLTTHGAWSPVAKDTPEKIRQSELLSAKLRTLEKPFILAADFNLTKDSRVIRNYSRFATNLAEKFGFINTLNPRTHYAKKLFPPGLAVDHIFATKEFQVTSCRVLESLDLSDHLGLVAELDL